MTEYWMNIERKKIMKNQNEPKRDEEKLLRPMDSADMPIRITELCIRYTSGANADYRYQYGYDDAGNIKSSKTTLKDNTSYTATFSYDALGNPQRLRTPPAVHRRKKLSPGSRGNSSAA